MQLPLLTTKLYIPPLRPNWVRRPRLCDRLDEGLRRGSALTLLCAPAGCGKTTLVISWLQEAAYKFAWLSLDEADNDPIRFVAYLIAALQQVEARIGCTLQPLLEAPQPPPLQSLAVALLNEVAALEPRVILVLDDLHLAHSEVSELLRFLVEHQPPTLHWVITTREDPSLPLPRLRARGRLTELREADLRFTQEEAALFLRQTMGLSLTADAVQALESRTEGWISGLQLAALALQEQPADSATLIARFTGDDRYVMDYLLAEVLQRQPPALRDFMLQTAILERFTPALCDAVTGRSDSAALLAQLERGQAFLVPLDRQRHWFRYHRLFAEALRARLAPGLRQELHRRAAHGYAAHDCLPEAIHHALAGDDPAAAERWITAAAEPILFSGGLATLRSWLAALPPARRVENGELAIYHGWLLALTGEIAQAEAVIAAAETGPGCPAVPAEAQGKLLVLRGFIALLVHHDYESAASLMQAALEALGASGRHWQVIALWIMAEALERTRPISEAVAAFQSARDVGLATGNHVFVATVEMSLVMALNNHGQRRAALALCEAALARYRDEDGRTLPLAGMLFSRLGLLHYETNQLEPARRCHDQAIAFTRQLALGGDITFSQGFAAGTLYALGETRAALAALQAVSRIAEQTRYTDGTWCRAWEANIHLRQGDLAFAERWAQAAGLGPEDQPAYLRLDEQVTYARLLIAQGRLDAAQTWLVRLEEFFRERALGRPLITVKILQAALALHRQDEPAIRTHLEAALRLAAPENYVRAFLDEEPALLPFLAGLRETAPAFVDLLLGYARVPARKEILPAEALGDPLSGRELEVLRLLAAGLSNEAIARALFIAPGTVKQHLKHIYEKLQINNRTAAARRAQELGLL